MTLMRIGLALVFPAIACGCVLGGVSTISEPRIAEHSASLRYDDGVIYFDGLSISVRPQNVDVGVLTGGILVPVIPLGRGNRVDTSKPFDLVLQFEAERRDVTFNPVGVSLETDASPTLPSKSFGPFEGGHRLTPLSSNTPGHRWGCDLPFDLLAMHEISEPIEISGKKCVVIRFPVTTVKPEEDFSVLLTELYAGANMLEPIKVSFSKASKIGAEVLGGQ